MSIDPYTKSIGEMIELFKEYNPGTVSISNIIRLCQTLRLESFTDEVNNEVSRLSIASKIIVIDIDFDKRDGSVRDIKLVLASNFDNFNYYEHKLSDDPLESDLSQNILLNSLLKYPDLKKFHYNLQFLCLLDAYSNIDSDPISSADNLSGLSNASTQFDSLANIQPSPTSNANSNRQNSSPRGKLDLFKYFTELSEYMKSYLDDHAPNLDVATNLNSKFGIYILSKYPSDPSNNDSILGKITLKKSKNPQHRLYEYVYSQRSKAWINENSESYASGVCLVLDIIPSATVYFPKNFISNEMLSTEAPSLWVDLEKESLSTTLWPQFHDPLDDTKESPLSILGVLSNVEIGKGTYMDSGSSGNKTFIDDEKLGSDNKETDSKTIPQSELYYDDKIQLVNDFTSTLCIVRNFDLSNDNLELLADIMNWMLWFKMVLEQVMRIMTVSKNDSGVKNEENANVSQGNFKTDVGNAVGHRPQGSPLAALKRRRSSSKNRRPSLTEASMLKAEGLHQFNLQEIMSETAIVDEGTGIASIKDEIGFGSENNGLNGVTTNEANNMLMAGKDGNMDTDSTKQDNFGMGNNGDNVDFETNLQAATSVGKLGYFGGTSHEVNGEADSELTQLIISEDYIYLDNVSGCDLYDSIEKWEQFIKDFQKFIA